MSDKKEKAQGTEKLVWKSYSVATTTGSNPLLVSVHEIKPREMRSTKFGGKRTLRDTDHQDAGGDGVDGVDHGD